MKARGYQSRRCDGGGRARPKDARSVIRALFRFSCLGGLLTNFHLPQSMQLMLVFAFGGHDLEMRAYREAIERGYRFYSYGDAMLLV